MSMKIFSANVHTSCFQFFTGRVPFLLPNQQCQSTEGNLVFLSIFWKIIYKSDLMTEFGFYPPKDVRYVKD